MSSAVSWNPAWCGWHRHSTYGGDEAGTQIHGEFSSSLIFSLKNDTAKFSSKKMNKHILCFLLLM